ncbi:MAG TPA: AMP-binding protein [Pseudomonadales bacterium]|nr:AMP-binding protein [Pseudomonadales bacterium]
MNVLPLDNTRDRNLGRILFLQAQQIPDAPCYLVDDKTYSFAEVNSHVNRYATGLASLGVTKGDRVVIYMRSCVEFIFMAFAANKLGAIWVPINADYKGSWLAEAIKESKGKILLTDTDKWPRINEVLAANDYGKLIVKVLGDAALPAGAVALSSFDTLPDAEPAHVDIDYGDTSAILWTSGTTGKSKGVLQPHNVWINAAESAREYFGAEKDDVIYNCMPLYNTGAWITAIFRALVVGIPCAIDEHFSASQFWNRIAHYKATETTTLGAMHMFLWNAAETPDDANNTLRHANVIPLPPHLAKPFMKRFGIKKIQKGFGQSEAALIMRCLEDGVNEWKPNCLGDFAPGVEVSLRDDEGNECPPGTLGEFCLKPLRPYAIFNGYFENPEATAKAYHGEWYRTGDLGVRDADGDYFFVDRKSDYIRDKGRNISSLQVEHAVMQHPAVQAAACFGIPSEFIESEAELKVDVILKPGMTVTAEELARFVNDNAPYFFVPRYIEFVTELPYTPTNKVQKYKLREKGLTGNVWDRTKTDFKLKK